VSAQTDPADNWARNPASLFDVQGKSAIVVGATGAYGSLAAKVLAAAGANLTLCAGSVQTLQSVVEECSRLGARTVAVTRRSNTEIDAAAITAAAVAAYGSVDIFVAASGVNDVAPIEGMTPERFMKVMEANVTGTWLMARAVGAQMIKQGRGGKVVLTSSARGLLGHPAGYSAYCASKSAVDGLTRALGCEWGKYAITVNAIAPTVFRSPLTAWMFEDNDKANAARAGFLSRVPLGRLGEPADLAGPLLFLCSRASDFYTGHILYADGGYTAG
jgi:NAD(P)-dependent dehydrogenase (short-subunit alcohol dehydrogenase family)